MDKKGQGISINVIIVAVIALVVLVVLLAIFMGKITIFDIGVSKAASALLATKQITYGIGCGPTAAEEKAFGKAWDAADKENNEEAKAFAEASFEERIDQCKAADNKEACTGSCKWR